MFEQEDKQEFSQQLKEIVETCNHWKEVAEKSNEWHYPSKGELPKECENILCYCKGMGIKFYCVGHTIASGDNKVRWWANNKEEELCVIAWKEIVPPKMSKEPNFDNSLGEFDLF